jgi:hypothetical protein
MVGDTQSLVFILKALESNEGFQAVATDSHLGPAGVVFLLCETDWKGQKEDRKNRPDGIALQSLKVESMLQRLEAVVQWEEMEIFKGHISG